MIFDKSKPYAEVFGQVDGHPNARYSQGGVYFRHDGQPTGTAPQPDVPSKTPVALSRKIRERIAEIE